MFTRFKFGHVVWQYAIRQTQARASYVSKQSQFRMYFLKVLVEEGHSESL